jgi:DNA-binding NarL/FixJ family response regulator
MTIRVLCADDHVVVRVGLAAMIANEPDIALVAEAGDGVGAVALYAVHRLDVVLMICACRASTASPRSARSGPRIQASFVNGLELFVEGGLAQV